MIKSAIDKLSSGSDLTEGEMMNIMEDIMDGKASDAQIGAFLTALKIKGETSDEIFAGASVMKKKALEVNMDKIYSIDTCGTGGDAKNTFNVSTAVMFVAAAAGVTVVKHGNRSVSSKCGSADVLEKLGVNINLSPENVRRCIDELNLGFMFAPRFHTAMKNVMKARQELGMRTIFNVLGPLANPASVKGQLIGVFDKKLMNLFAQVLNKMGTERALIVHGEDGLDEITLTGSTSVCELRDGQITSYEIKPEDFGLESAELQELVGGDSEHNAQIIKEILAGKTGAKRDMVVLNAGAAIYVGKKADSLKEGIELAKDVIDRGLALEKLEKFAELTRGLGE